MWSSSMMAGSRARTSRNRGLRQPRQGRDRAALEQVELTGGERTFAVHGPTHRSLQRAGQGRHVAHLGIIQAPERLAEVSL